MFPSRVFLLLILISLATVDASPLSRSSGKGTLSFATRINKSGELNIAEKDRARAQALKDTAHLSKRAVLPSVNVTNTAIWYTAQVGIGSPPTYYTLIVDTGSSNICVGTSEPYVPTSSSEDTGEPGSVYYPLTGSCSGEEWIDFVTIGPDLAIVNQYITVASSSSGFSGVDGVLGLGPDDLTVGTLTNIPTETIPTVVDNLYTQGRISEEVLGIYFTPYSAPSTGELTFGGYDSTVVTSSVNYVPLTTTSPASLYWGIDQSITYGGSTILSSTAGIVDTGTTLILIASNAYQTYQSATGATLDSTTGLLTISSSQYSSLQPLSFNIGGTSYNLSPNGQIWPRSLNTYIGGNASSIYLIVNDLGSPSGQGLDFIDGQTFLERFYSVFDTTNGRVGFATTQYTDATTN